MSSPGKTLYALLNVSADANQLKLDAAYQAILRQYADIPDSPQKQQRLETLKNAYDLLSNPVRRSVYDASLKSGSGPTVELSSLNAKPSSSRFNLKFNGARLDAPQLGLIAIAVVTCLGLGGYFIASRSVHDGLTTVQRETLEMQQAAMKRQEAAMEAAERENNGTSTHSEYMAQQQERERKFKAEQEERQRDREMDNWQSEVGRRMEQDARQAERSKQQAEYAKREQERQERYQQEQQAREALSRVDQERRQMMEKLISEKRFSEARQFAKTEYDYSRIDSAERYARPSVKVIESSNSANGSYRP
ncbi:DnaJ domain-containing protein [Parachitinimonas caeni]|uniref:DnaJ domain-containing protein n=1 Tax=Parachitinimonas caeni TaxID=3031301 RepID=A0ABT7DRL6_9NEIS|nr:DnaJ domain-containing protein [Parachitinimonas caeni]MDK2122706.1 DnaJ domain-containing protein [Parachitinimonas caeni]